MANVGAVHDLSGVGRCSLTTAISVLAAMGHHCCPIPTAILSKQTGFPGYSLLDFTPHLLEYLSGWEDLDLELEILYSGFLGNPSQPALLAGYMKRHPDATIVVDPVMGDDGKLYPCFDLDYVEQMRLLVEQARIITPNLTELLLLSKQPLDTHTQDLETGEILRLLRLLDAPKLTHGVITGVMTKGGVHNLVVDLVRETVDVVPGHHTGVSFSGTGDLLASILCGCLANGESVLQGVVRGTRFVEQVALSVPRDADPRYGLPYERFLYQLVPGERG